MVISPRIARVSRWRSTSDTHERVARRDRGVDEGEDAVLGGLGGDEISAEPTT